MKILRINNFIVSLFILTILFYPTTASYYSSGFSDGGSVTIKSTTYQQALDGNYVFGKLSGTMNEQGATHATVTLGRTAHETSMDVDASTTNSYQRATKVETLGMINSYDNAGFDDQRSNIPDTICDAESLMTIEENDTSSRYPSEEYGEGMFGTMASGNVVYDASIGVVGNSLYNSMRLDADQGTLSKDFRSTALKGFNKSSANGANYENRIWDHEVAYHDETVGVHAGMDTAYNGFTDAYDPVLNVTTVNEYTSGQIDLNESVNETETNTSELYELYMKAVESNITNSTL